MMNMENVSQITDAFLSNNFHQLYSELNYSDDVCSWDSNELSSGSYNYYSDYSNYYNYSDIFLNESYNQNNIECNNVNNCNINSNNNSNETFNYDTSEQSSSDNFILLETKSFQTINNFDFDIKDFNLENILLDDMVNFDELKDQYLLPEKTALCNETCNLFLQESSENLKLSYDNSLADSHNTSEMPSDLNQNGNYVNSISSSNSNKIYEKNFPCTYGTCSKIYAKPAHLKAHMRRHLGDKPYICTWPNCTWRFSRSDELARHRRSHSGVKPYKCCYCTKCFARSDHLAKHRKVHERKMAASKLKILWPMPAVSRPGRKPKVQEGQVSSSEK